MELFSVILPLLQAALDIDPVWILYLLAGNLALDILSVPVLFVGYVFYTGVDRVRWASGRRLPGFVWLLSSLALWTAAKVDVYVNFSLATKLFVALPPWGKWTLSQRMTYYWDNLPPDSRRRRLVVWIKDNTWIDRFDRTGQHIGNKP